MEQSNKMFCFGIVLINLRFVQTYMNVQTYMKYVNFCIMLG